VSNHQAPTVYRVPATIAAVIEADSVLVVLRPLADLDLSIEAALTATEARDLARVLDGTAEHLATAPARLRAVTR
jgi:hypothetical protein